VVDDADWGKLQVTSGTPDYSPVVDRGEASETVFTGTINKYGAGSGSVNVFIRGSGTAFGQHDVSPAWQAYTAPVQQFWRYIQVKLEEAV
jgi:hypothetical protein